MYFLLTCILTAPRWLNTEFVGIDANFRLKRFNVSSILRDPPLNNGWAYTVEQGAYSKFLLEFKNAESEPKVNLLPLYRDFADSHTEKLMSWLQSRE